ncbi:Uncharacterized protein OBRU01_02760 [Operophtera brumata]|uniref:Uncharacterized protein n=1 Tax=Operophtera brumata TaxID=104452 RepID=A0A0L7LRZ9_OPEBR|nr:Uncharacterized protein OBRU01_02760 [Operophtera brumata]
MHEKKTQCSRLQEKLTFKNRFDIDEGSPSITSTFVDSDEISLRSDSDLEDLPSYFFTHLEKQKEANEEILRTSVGVGKKTKTTKLTSNSKAEKDLDDIEQNNLIKTTILMDKEELILREKEIERIIKEIRAEEKAIENTKNYTVIEREISKVKENEGKENILIQTNIITQEKTQVRDDTKYPNKKDSNQSKKKVNIISSVLVTPDESAFTKYSIRNLKIINPKSDLCNPNPNKSLAGIQMKGDEQENTTEHPIQPTLYDVGDTVLTRYFKKTWIYYVGTIKSVDTNERKYTISFCRTVGKHENVMFVVPKRKDEDYVPEKNIVKTIELLQINENPVQYALLNDEDSVYF